MYQKFDGGTWDNDAPRNARYIDLWNFLIENSTKKSMKVTILGVSVRFPAGIYSGTVREISRGIGVPVASSFRLLKKLNENRLIEYCSASSFLDDPIEFKKGHRNPLTRRKVNIDNYRVIRIMGKINTSQSTGNNDSPEISEKIEIELSRFPKHKYIKVDEVTRYLSKIRESIPELTDDRFLRNFTYALRMTKKSFFPYLHKSIKADYGVNAEFSEKKPVHQTADIAPDPKPEFNFAQAYREFTKLDERTRNDLLHEAEAQIIKSNPALSPNSPQYKIFLNDAVTNLYRKRQLTR